MVEASEPGLKEEEIELDLGLSIGGSFRKPEKLQLVNGFGLDRREKENQTASSEPESALLDSQTKREIQALRRQEAKRKREEKRSRGRNEAQTEEQQQQPAIKRERTEANVNVNVNLNMSNGETEPRYPVQPGQYPYTPVQFVPYTNGFAYPCAMPCWAPSGGGGFRPFQAHKNLANNGCETEQNGGVGKTTSSNGGLGKTGSLNGSPMCSSSTVSDRQSAASHEGGGSSETRSHSSQSLPEKTHLNNGSISKETKAQSEHTATSNSFESNCQGNDQKLAPKEEPKSENTEPVSIPKPISSNGDSATPTSPPLKEITKMDPFAKPPKPQTQTSSLPQMPYVSTTGNGPNGKTIHGFLYSYTKSEISIVCVCHGSTFSPAEFVQHAGGTDVSQPLRHITVIPSAFG
ncbi:hypothetical protein ACE6H2_028069 [Prunus campanulata]